MRYVIFTVISKIILLNNPDIFKNNNRLDLCVKKMVFHIETHEALIEADLKSVTIKQNNGINLCLYLSVIVTPVRDF